MNTDKTDTFAHGSLSISFLLWVLGLAIASFSVRLHSYSYDMFEPS